MSPVRPSRLALPLISLLALGLAGVEALSAPAGSPSEADRFFEMRIRPVLAEHCSRCHGDEAQKAGLRVDSLEALLRGGDSGPALVPGDLDESLFVEAIRHDGLAMPPGGKLDAAIVADLERWVRMGAPWPGADTTIEVEASPAGERFSEEDRAYWAFQPFRTTSPPEVADPRWSDHPIDRFLYSTLTSRGLEPAPEAERRTLIRRLSFDLTGLPPEPAEVEAFVNDPTPDAYERLVDRLLESPAYGERWARIWLDLVRFAESDGYRQDAFRPQAWRYRDYVVEAFNQDTPYDRFIAEQLAGDELAPDDPRMRVATQFLRLWSYEYNQRDVPGQWAAILNDMTDVTGEVFLGLGLACARCHDHKFDAVLQEDYYRLQAFFTPLLPRDDLVEATAAERADHGVRRAAWDLLTADIRAEMAAIERPHRQAAHAEGFAKFQPELQAILLKPANERSPHERQLAYLAERQFVEEFGKIDGKIKGAERERYEILKKQLPEFDGIRPDPPRPAFAATDVGPVAPATTIPGDRRGRKIEPGFLAVLEENPAEIEPVPDSTGRRLALARWLTRPDNPLTARVMVNRVWQGHFGTGLVATPSDFGRLGEPPSHPELLDWLATRFIEDGWSVKALHRLIVTTAAYRQSATQPKAEVVDLGRRIDPENRLLWRRTPTRLEAEPIRDAMLAASGELDTGRGGPSVNPDRPRRSLYVKAIRNAQDPLLAAFDAPDGSSSTARRNVTTSPTQSLLLINGPWILKRASAFAGRLEDEASDDAGRVDRAFRLAFGRPPSDGERREAIEFLRGSRAVGGVAATDCSPEEVGNLRESEEALVDFCHALLNANEFFYVD